MPLYRYVKAKPKKPIRFPLIVSLFLMAGGVTLLGWASWPILSFSLFTAPLFSGIVTPLQESASVTDKVQAADIVLPSAGTTSDFTDPNLWFPTKPQKKVVTPVNTYTLSIPKLGITNALVVIAGGDLNLSLIHYGGTGLPGDFGNAVIFGHSILPQFFNPKNYKSIFSTLPTLEEGDDIYISFDDVTYRYKVEDMTVRDPSDLTALEQRYDDSYITLITCVPPGTYWKRLNVRARLAKI